MVFEARTLPLRDGGGATEVPVPSVADGPGRLPCAVIGGIWLAAARQKPYMGGVRGGASGRITAITAFHSNGFRHVRLTRAADRTA